MCISQIPSLLFRPLKKTPKMVTAGATEQVITELHEIYVI